MLLKKKVEEEEEEEETLTTVQAKFLKILSYFGFFYCQ